MHTFWLSYPFQWNTSTDISTFVRNYFKSSIYNLYFLFRKFHSTFSVFFFAGVLYFWNHHHPMTKLYSQQHYFIEAISTQTSMPWWNHPLLGIFGFVCLCARPTFQTDHWLSTLFTRCMKTKVPPKLMMAWTSANVLECSRAPACECDTSIRWGPRYFDKLLFSTQRRSLLIYTHSLVWGFDCGRYGFW